jgi:hypothetical protein
MNEARQTNWGLWILVNALVAATLLYQIFSPGEAPSQAVAMLQYVLLAMSTVGLVGSIVKFFSEK